MTRKAGAMPTGLWQTAFRARMDGPQGGLGAAAARARAKRRREAFSELMNSLDDDSCRDLKTMIRANANGNGRGAFIILERECGETTSTLDDGAKVAE